MKPVISMQYLHTCSLEYNKKLWSPPQVILVTEYFLESNKSKESQEMFVTWPIFNTRLLIAIQIQIQYSLVTWLYHSETAVEYFPDWPIHAGK